MTVSNHIMGVYILDVREKSNMILRANKNPNFVTWDSEFTPNQRYIYAVDGYYGLFIADVNAMFSFPIGST